MAGFKRFEDIQAWQAARKLTFLVNSFCADGAASRNFAFRNQICGAAMSAMSNIAEGLGRNTDKDFAHFLDIAKASAMEVQSLLYVAVDLKYLDDEQFRQLYVLTDETASMIGALIKYLRK